MIFDLWSGGMVSKRHTKPPLWLILSIFLIVTLLQFPTSVIAQRTTVAFGIFVDQVLFILLIPLLILRLAGFSMLKHLKFGDARGGRLLVAICMVFGLAILLGYLKSATSDLIPISEKVLKLQMSVIWAYSWQDFFMKLILLAVIAPICEEILFRGFIQDTIADRIGDVRAVIITAIFYALLHSTSFQPILYLILGLGFSWIYAVTRSLRIVIICHAVNNAWALTNDIRGVGFPLQRLMGGIDYALIILCLMVVIASLAWLTTMRDVNAK